MKEASQPSPAYEASPYYLALRNALQRRGREIDQLCPLEDPVARRVLHDYGAMFVGADTVLPPSVCVFSSEQQVADFQKAAGRSKTTIDGAAIELQPARARNSRHARLVSNRAQRPAALYFFGTERRRTAGARIEKD